MKKFSKSVTLAAVAVAALVQQVNAQQVDQPPFVVANGSTSNLPVSQVVIDTSVQKDIAIKWTVQLNGAGTEIMGLRFCPSVDGILPSAHPPSWTLAIAANGATPVIVQTNFTMSGYRFLHLCYMTNGSAGQLATNTVSYYVKRGAP